MTGAAQDRPTLPRAWFVEADSFARERRAIFAEAWQMIACDAALAAPGDYVCNSLAGLAAFVMRNEAGKIHALRNVCRHQKLPVLDAGAGKSTLLRCRYHGWTYNFDGTFNEAPAKYAPDGQRPSPENDLARLPLTSWRGLLFVAPEEEASPLSVVLKPLDDAIDRVLAGPVARVGEVTTDFQCNWKLLLEHWLVSGASRGTAADGSMWLFVFPTLALQASADALVAHQVVVRSYDRTRVVSHLLARRGVDSAPLLDRVKAMHAADKAICDARQAEAAAGREIEAAPAAPGSALAEFRVRVAAAHRDASASA